VASDLAQQHPFLSFQVRANYRHHQAHVYTVAYGPVREDHYAVGSLRIQPGEELAGIESLRADLMKEPELVILFGDGVQGEAVRQLLEFGASLAIPVRYVCLLDYSNSRGALEMGLLPDPQGGMNLEEILAHEDLGALWVVGANPLKNHKLAAKNAFLVVQELFLTETAQAADVVLPAASAYEKSGTVTNVCGEIQPLRPAVARAGAKTDFEIFRLLAIEMGFEMEPLIPERITTTPRGGSVQSARDTLFTSGTLGRYSKTLNSVSEGPGGLYRG
jgi:NADH-quinone oxidoreductase subunit G